MGTVKSQYYFGPVTVTSRHLVGTYEVTGYMDIHQEKANGKVEWYITYRLDGVLGGHTKLESDSVTSPPSSKATAWVKSNVARRLAGKLSFKGSMSWR